MTSGQNIANQHHPRRTTSFHKRRSQQKKRTSTRPAPHVLRTQIDNGPSMEPVRLSCRQNSALPGKFIVEQGLSKSKQ